MKKKISISIDEELLEQIMAIAKNENRNLSNMLETLLREALASK